MLSLYSRGWRGRSDARDATGCHRLAAAQPVAAAQLVRVPCGGPLLHLPQPLDAGEHAGDLRARSVCRVRHLKPTQIWESDSKLGGS